MRIKHTQHENYRELIWMLAKTDFKLRYQGSVLGYVWALLKPLLMFSVLYFVFSSVFNYRNDGTNYFALELLIGIMMFNFFSEGTNAGLNALLGKSQLVTKIYVPRWTIIIASTLNAAMIYVANLAVIVLFFALYKLVPSPASVGLFVLFSLSIYVLIVAFSFLMAPLQVLFRDIAMIWEVVSQVLFFATPVMYPLSMMPAHVQQIMLINPMAFIVHFTKTAFTINHLPDPHQIVLFVATLALALAIGITVYRKLTPTIAEKI